MRNLNRIQTFILITLSLAMSSLASIDSADANEVDQANAMLSYFNSGCPGSSGEWTKAALISANNLIEVVKSLRDDSDCKTIAGSMGQLGLISARLNAIDTDPNGREIYALKKIEQQILLHMTLPLDATAQENMKLQLQAVQRDLARYQGYQSASARERKDRRDGESMHEMVLSTQALLSQASASPLCMQKNPQLLSGVASLAGSVGAVAMTGGYSLGLAAGTQLFGDILESLRKTRSNRKIRGLAQSITQTAYECVLESLGNQWCAAQESLSIIDLEIKTLSEPSNDPLITGNYLLDREIPTFLNWLNRIASGTEPTNQAVAERKALMHDRANLIRKARDQGNGVLNQAQVSFDQWESEPDQIKKVKQQWTIIKTAILEMMDKVGVQTSPYAMNSGSPNPLTEIMDGSYAPYAMLGISREKCPKQQGSLTCSDFRTFDAISWARNEGEVYTPDMKLIRDNFKTWIDEGKDKVDREISIISNPDPLQLISDAMNADLWGRTPYDSALEIIDYLRTHRPKRFPSLSQDRLYKETIDRIQNIVDVIEDVNNSSPTKKPEPPRDEITAIYQAAELDSGTVLIGGRLERAVRLVLNERLIDALPGKETALASQLIAAKDLVEELKRYSGKSDLHLIVTDLMNSQTVVNNTLQEFINLFGPRLYTMMWDLESKSKITVNKDFKNYDYKLTDICLKLLAVPEWPDSIPMEMCLGRVRKSDFLTAPPSVTITEALINGDHTARTCAYRNFVRSVKIHQSNLERKTGVPKRETLADKIAGTLKKIFYPSFFKR